MNKILVVDDERQICDLIAQALEAEGYDVIAVESAEEALEIEQQEDIYVYFFDMKLPGMDGIELINKIKYLRPSAIFFAITGFSNVYDLLKCREAGFDDYFPKPFRLQEIIKATNDAFEKIDRWQESLLQT